MVGRDVLISWLRNIPWSSQKTKDFRLDIIWDFFSSIWDFFAILCQASRYRAWFQASSGHSDSVNRPGYEAGIGSKLSTILKVTELSYPCNVAATVFAGGCPYPGIEGDQIANKLKDGYRMPKPKHIDQKLWVECLSYSVKNISFVKEMIFRRIDKHVKFIKNCGLWHFLIRCRNVTLPIYLLCSFLIVMCLKIILHKTMHRVTI